MSGQLRTVVDRAFDELWQPLTDLDDCPIDIFGEIYAELRQYLREPKPEHVREEDGTIRDVKESLDGLVAVAMSDPRTAERLLGGLTASSFETEAGAVSAIGGTYEVLSDLASSDLADRYVHLLREFVDRYSLRYYVDSKATLWISFSGLATAIFGHVRSSVEKLPDLQKQLAAFEHTLAECIAEPMEDRIKTAIQKQVNFLEALGSRHNHGVGKTLGEAIGDAQSWPHDSLSDAARLLYKFTCDYPGIRHGGSSKSAARDLDVRDLAGVTLSLLGLTIYLTEEFEVLLEPDLQGDLASLQVNNNVVAPWQRVLATSSSTK